MANIPGQLENAQLENLTATPSNLPEGRKWVNTTTDREHVVLGGAAKEVVTTDQAQTLTNKTLTSPTITTPTGLVKGDVGLGSVDNTSDLNKPVSTATQTALDDKASLAQLATHEADTTNIHGIADTAQLATLTGAQTLTQKTLTSPILNSPNVDVLDITGQVSAPAIPSAGNYKAYIKTSTNKLTIMNSLGVETPVGSGGTGVNFIEFGDGEAGTSGWSTYADAAGTSPVDGSGGTATGFSISATFTSTLAGNQSLLFSKFGGTNIQGEGISYPFTVEPAYRARVLKITFDYILASGSFTAGSTSADSQLTVWIYDVDNARLIQPSQYKILSNSTTVADQFQAEFQTSSNSTSYRLIFHNGTTNTSDYTLMVDNVSVAPNEYVLGSGILETILIQQASGATGSATASTDTLVAFTTATGSVGTYAVSGNAVRIQKPGRYIARAKINIVSNADVLTFKLDVNGTKTSGESQTGVLNAAGSWNIHTESFIVDLNSGDLVSLYVHTTATRSYKAAELELQQLTTPSVQMADQTTTRVVAARAYVSSGVSTTSGNPFNFDTVSFDKTNSISTGTTTWKYTAPVPGTYRVSVNLYFGAGNGTVFLYKNGSIYSALGGIVTSTSIPTQSTLIELNAGDYIDVRANATVTPTAQGGATVGQSNHISIERISGPSQIAASETIAARYYISSAASTTSANPINYETKDYDTHGCVTTGVGVWKFTARISGIYRVSVTHYFGATTSDFRIFKNGTLLTISGWSIANTSQGVGTTSISLNAGDYIDIRPGTTVTPSTGYLTSSVSMNNHISIERIGNRG